jgi:O-glycosyl hydrolase
MKYIRDIIGKTVVIVSVGLALSLMARAALAQVATVTIDWNGTHQTIDGFGTSQAAFAPILYA